MRCSEEPAHAPAAGAADNVKVTDTDVHENELKELCEEFKAFYKKKKGEDFPQDPNGAALGRGRRPSSIAGKPTRPSPIAGWRRSPT